MTGLYQVKNRIDNILYRRLFHSRLQRRVVRIIPVHQFIHNVSRFRAPYFRCSLKRSWMLRSVTPPALAC
jgi:hypothetical protein